MKNILFIFATSLLVLDLPAKSLKRDYSLSGDSQVKVVVCAILGGLTGLLTCKMIKGDYPELAPEDSAVSVFGAVAGAFFAYYGSYEKQREREDNLYQENIEQKFLAVLTQLKQFKTDHKFQKLQKSPEVLNIKTWHKTDSHYPFMSAHSCLSRFERAIYLIITELEKISQFDCKKIQNLEKAIKKARKYQQLIKKALKIIEESGAYRKEYKVWKDNQPKPQLQPVVHQQPTPIANPYAPVAQPAKKLTVVHPQPVAPKPVTPAPKPVPTPPAPQKKPETTISPILEGDVYGTIWSNY